MAPSLFLVGLSHHTAPVEIRERLAVDGGKLSDAVLRIQQAAQLNEALLVSTCNRVELYGSAQDPVRAASVVRGAFEEDAGRSLSGHLYERQDSAAARHAFRVAASLDSLVVGEPQILGQVKQSFSTASEAGVIGPLLARCFHRAFAVAKRVRTETGIAAGAVSVSSIATELAGSIFGELTGRRVVLVGAGEMAEGAARALTQQGTLLTVVNRSPERAQELARQCGGEARGFEQLAAELTAGDVVISSTASPRYVITRELMQGVVRARRHRPLFLIDIAVPRDVDPRVENMDNVFLYDVDDLEKVAGQNLATRKKEADAASRIVDDEVAAFEAWLRSLDLTPTLVGLRERVRAVIHSELQRTLPRLSNVSDKERKTLEAMCDAMTNKILHRPLTELKRSREEPDGAALVSSVRRLFDLEAEADDKKPAQATNDPRLSPAGGRSGDRS